MSKHFQFDAYQAYADLRRRYVDFLTEIVGIRGGALPGLLDTFWNSDGADSCLFAPLLVQGVFPFEDGKPLRDLLGDRSLASPPLQKRTVELLEQAGVSYSLFAHQVEAISQAAQGKSVVIAAGTGSGKTEAFLFPIINRLIRDHEQGLDDLSEPGVRALIVYPLNALVNSQVDRLLDLLQSQTQITFAYYTRRLKDTRARAERDYEFRRRPVPPECQILDRQSLRGLDGRAPRKGPPHILVTNYSMLEYMLIRPLDRTIFLSGHTQFKGKPRLKTIVLDEAHVYAGAQAAEMHMLLRRAADRFGTRLEEVQGFATSATLSQGGGTEGTKALMEFACKMFLKPPEQMAVIEGKRRLPVIPLPQRDVPPLQVPSGGGWEVPAEIRTIDFKEDGSSALIKDRATADMAAKAAIAFGLATERDLAGIPEDERDQPASVLFQLCASHPSMLALRSGLFNSAQIPTIDEAADILFGPGDPSDQRRRATDAALRLASLAREKANELPLIPVRMHAFIRAPLGAWVDPRPETDRSNAGWPWGRLHLLPDDSSEIPRLQLHVCLACGAPFLEAIKKNDAYGIPDGYAHTVALICHPEGDIELPILWGGQKVSEVEVLEKDRHGNLKISQCPRCGTSRVLLRCLRLSPRLALSAMLDSIYPHLGELPSPSLPGGGRRLITFSDSRQNAARVAAEVERTHDIGLSRQIIRRLLQKQAAACRGEGLIRLLSSDPLLRQRALSSEISPGDDGLLDLARLSVYQEFSRPPARAREQGKVTLEMLGLVEVRYPDLPPRPREIPGLSDSEWEAFLSTVLDLARASGVVASANPDFRARQNEVEFLEILPRVGRCLKLSEGGEEESEEEEEERAYAPNSSKPLRLIPQNDSLKDRSRIWAYAVRIGVAVGVSPETLLVKAWEGLWRKAETGCVWLDKGGDPESLRVKLDRLEFVCHEKPPFLSPETSALYFRTVKGIVPEGGAKTLARPLTDEEVKAWASRHSVRRVIEDQALGLWTVEHTAQLDVDTLEDQERQFRAGKRNLLASSTTMEMGIDIGGLTFVCLTNVPPGPANYWQRAGRAGRRADGTSATMTLALVNPHDQLVFSSPRDFLFSPLTPPRVRLDAEPLLVRHINGYLLARFFEEAVVVTSQGNPMKAFGTVRDFVVEKIGGNTINPEIFQKLALSPADPIWVAFSRWLSSLSETDPIAAHTAELCKGTILAADTLPQLAARASADLDESVERVRRDLDILESQEQQEKEKGAGAQDNQLLLALKYQRSAIVEETLISYLASNGFLPRFGFPLDVVRLNTRWEIRSKRHVASGEAPPEMRMERALDLALAEYTPGSKVLAGKRVFRSAGIERNWFSDEGAVERHFFFECVNCRHLEDGLVQHERCPVCGHPTKTEGQFIDDERDRAGQKKRRRGGKGDGPFVDPSILPPSITRQYLRPSGFAVKLGEPPRRLSGDLTRIGRAVTRLVISSPETARELVPGALSVSYCPSSRVFTRAEGNLDATGRRGYGFIICRVCGLSLPEEGWGRNVPKAFQGHKSLRGSNKCPCNDQFWRNRVLGTSLPVDALRIELRGDMAPRFRDPQSIEAFYVTLAAVLQLVSSRCLQVDLRALASGVATRKVGDGFVFDAIVYESATSGLLRHLAENPAMLIDQLLSLLESGRKADFVRFDTQSLGMRLRPDLVREHFLAERTKALLQLRQHPGVSELQGRGPLLAAIELLDDAANSIGLIAGKISSQAFEQYALMPHVRARAVSPKMKGVPIRLLLQSVPITIGDGIEESLAAAQLKRLIEDGVKVRRAASADESAIMQFRWHMVARKGDVCEAIGGMESESNITQGSDRFGPRWLSDLLPIEADREEARKAVDQFEKYWGRGVDVDSAGLTPKRLEKTSVVAVRKGSRSVEDTNPRRLLERALVDFGGLAGCGRVNKLVYADRYVVRSLVSLYFLKDLLSGFEYNDKAKVLITALPPDSGYSSGGNYAQSPDILRMLSKTRPPYNLNKENSDVCFAWLVKELAGKTSVVFNLESTSQLPHARKLLVEFALGGKIKTLKVCFDQGLDWVRSEAVSGPWTKGPFIANETQVVVSIDQLLSIESGWT